MFKSISSIPPYSFALDTGDWAAHAAVFDPKGTFSSGATKHVPETIAAASKRISSMGRHARAVGGHFIMNILLTPTAAGADGECYAFILNGTP